jgi:hypothetical protein
MLKETSTEATGKMKSDLRTTSGDNKSNSLVDDARALINGGNFHRFNILN